MMIWICNSGRGREKLTPARRRDCRLVVLTVASATGVRYCDFFARSRMRLHTASARQLAMYLCHTLLGITLTEVGQFFGRDRTTVAHACRQVEDGRDEGSPADIRILALEAQIDSARNAGARVKMEAFHAHL
ncbi:helix-turn-helix domain-containing protein [Pelagibacterium mangrovi]|uniref:helix-turn-helix domain-containing protein n=1 Tax=Pelagibacterium mangrovi TaxID=3119828 RepID=UPI002FC8C054